MEILRFIGPVELFDRLRDEIVHRFVRHRVAQYMVQHFADEDRDSTFVGIGRERARYVVQLGGTDGPFIRRQLDDRERAVLAGGVLAPQTIHHIINTPARACVGVQEVRFVRMGLE